MLKSLSLTIIAVIATLLLTTIFHPLSFLTASAQQSSCQIFPQTNKAVCGKFLAFWQQHGGLTVFGYPISNEFTEVSALNGEEYTVQYFERAVFELHPDNKPPYDVQLSQVGAFQYKTRYPKETSGN